MATRSTIALEYANGQVDQIYCHWDGYLDHNGKILIENYQDPFKVRELMDLGDLSSLGTVIGEKHPFSPFVSDTEEFKLLPKEEQERIKEEQQKAHEAAKEAGFCTFYGRDRGEDSVQAKRFADFSDYKKEHQYEEYEYILRTDGIWYVSAYGKAYVPVTEAIAAEAAEREAEAA